MASNFFKIRKGTTLEPVAGADPVGTNGDIYYNSTLQKFRKFENGAWSDLASGGGGGGGNAGWIAAEVTIPASASSMAVSFPSSQPDTSFVVLAQMINDVDLTPQFQQVTITAKTPGGFTASWNAPTDSNNYRLIYIVPMKAFVIAEVSVGSGVDNVTATLPIMQNGASYPLMAQLQNIIDASPSFMTTIVTNKTSSNFVAKFDDVTDSVNYKLAFIEVATAEVGISNVASSINVILPIDYGNTNYAVVAMMRNLADASPQFQPIVITSKSNNSFIASWSNPTDSANYTLIYYAISFS